MEFQINGPEILFPTLNVLSDRGIKAAITNGDISLNLRTEKQIQPASLDLSIGRVLVYDSEAMIKGARTQNKLTFLEALAHEPSQEFAKEYPNTEGMPIDLPAGCFAEIYFNEQLRSVHPTSIDLRSSRGRLSLQLKSLDHECAHIWNHNPNTIRLYGRTPFAQVFFHPIDKSDGHIVSDPKEAEAIAKQLQLKSFGPYVVFEIGDHAYRTRKTGLIDTKSTREDQYETLSTDKLEVGARETIIVQLQPRISLPADIGIKILHEIPYAHPSGNFHPDVNLFFMESRSANAGWVDPGYQGNATAHIRPTKFERLLRKGDPVALGVLFKFNKPVERPYGSKDLGSHYQNSTGTVAKS